MTLTDSRPQHRGKPGLILGTLAKLLRFNWAIVLLLCAIAGAGFLMLYSVSGGSFDPWSGKQITRFGFGLALMMVIGLIDLKVWKWASPFAYLTALGLLLAVEFVGTIGMGAQRWIQVGPISVQPSELMKISLILVLARYYSWLDPARVSHPLWLIPPIVMIAAPMGLVIIQPDLGTGLMLAFGGGVVLFLAGVSWWYFATVGAAVGGTVWVVLESRGTDWQILRDYQFRRIDTFLNPESDPLGSGYHITQSKIAMGSGGISGRGFMQGTQSRLNFLPEKHTDFIFTTLAEEFGFVGSLSLLTLYVLVIVFCFASMARNRDRFGALVTGGLVSTFFFFWAINMAMVMGLIPVVGVPLPLVSYGGSAMLVLLIAFGLIQSAHVHRR